ncbi:hypothetical protein LSH36_769g00113 [Paralvinella palmiformis]|uniref:Cell growth-regulating nucleolar protein n=1 Tax=Paralvinella palmiformis TaxID=53620 RepID=A0AAD9J1E4_9ANNE|nr:hypothetical protein LSH36_769g00113 [Paralvinella palmiformis]
MVFFTCNACGEALKKNQVEKHYMFNCRNCTVLSCVDCQKDFPGDTYKEHTKCISEEEKYSGRDWKPKSGANKGEQRQEAWIEKVSTAIDQCVARPQLKAILLQVKDYPNIPRKKVKFQNFLKNSLRIHGDSLITQAWDIITAETNQSKTEENPTDGVENLERKSENGLKRMVEKRKHNSDNEHVEESVEIDEPKKKRKQKETVVTHEENNIAEDFSWKRHLVELLSKASDNELPVKKVKKKLLKKMKAYERLDDGFTEEDFIRKFGKYINKKSKFTVVSDMIRLKV